MSDTPQSPNGEPRIPTRYTIPILLVAAVSMIIGEELTNSAPWSTARAGGFILKLVPSVMGILSAGDRKPVDPPSVVRQ